ncbi:hypothetical protein MASR2M15_10000 [Anaerolineales bacterium]
MRIEELQEYASALEQNSEILLTAKTGTLNASQHRMMANIRRVAQDYLKICSYEGWAERTENFFTDVCRELRTPLTTIKGYADLLLMHDEPLSAEQKKALKAINENVEKVVSWVENFTNLPLDL